MLFHDPGTDRNTARAAHTNDRENRHMLTLKPNCECCDRDLPPASAEALICSFECTFCTGCADQRFCRVCPNCGGDLVPRPIRPPELLRRHPGSGTRVTGDHEACAGNPQSGSGF
ncbi:DUF1272 domain-containing protein [Roseobacter sp. S98]|uniref:DUF1272 domain-containing protein n=1 Tax=Roseobacter algicola (ex Choi et al. 2025) (nom. illeg.) TaxID=3092138 RepID=UPI0035C7236A